MVKLQKYEETVTWQDNYGLFLNKDVEADMKDKVSITVKGKNAMRVGNYGEAIKCYIKALKMINEKDISTLQLVKGIHYDLATAYTSLECYKDAINEYKEVIMLSPNDVSAHYNLAIVYQMSNDVDNAFAQYQKVLAINPDYRDVKDKLAVNFSSHHKLTSYAIHNNKRQKLGSDEYDSLKKTLIINEDEREYPGASGGEEDSLARPTLSSLPGSSSLKSYSSRSESSSRSYSAEQPSDQQQSAEEPNQYSSNVSQSTSYEVKKSCMQVVTDKVDSPATDNLLMTLFTWIKDLPEAFQQQVLSSFSMQQVLRLLEKTIHPDKFIADQLNNQPVEERFAEECQQYFGQDGFASNSQECAQVNQDNSPISLDKDVEVISSDGVLVDPLPKHDINFNMPHLFSSIAS